MIITIHGKRFRVREDATLTEMREQCPDFFTVSQRKYFGDRSYTVHRGQLIVAATITYSGGTSEPRVLPYLFLCESLDDLQHRTPGLFYAGGGECIRPMDKDEAQQRLDDILQRGSL